MEIYALVQPPDSCSDPGSGQNAPQNSQQHGRAHLVDSATSDSECCGKACASGLLYDDSSGNTPRRSSPGGNPA